MSDFFLGYFVGAVFGIASYWYMGKIIPDPKPPKKSEPKPSKTTITKEYT